jgi:hypothetical protein
MYLAHPSSAHLWNHCEPHRKVGAWTFGQRRTRGPVVVLPVQEVIELTWEPHSSPALWLAFPVA